MRKIYLVLITVAVLFTGCDSKKYFEPESIDGSIYPTGSLPASIKHVKRDGATLEDGYVAVGDGVYGLGLKDGYEYVSNSKEYIFVSNTQGDFVIYNKSDKSVYKSIKMHTRVLSATIDDNIIAMSLMDNSHVMYNLNESRQIFYQKEDTVNAVDTRIANPYFFKDLVIIPTLNGKMLVVDRYKQKLLKNINIDTSKEFANVIFFRILDETLVAATQNKVISMSSVDINEKEMGIKDVLFFQNQIYTLGKDGTVTILGTDLEPIKSKKFPFAVFVGTINGESIYVLEKKGYVIALDRHLIKSNVYNFGAIEDSKIVTAGDKIYFGDKYFKVNKE
jgi:hypothetical protein